MAGGAPRTSTAAFVVAESDTAAALGSGSLPVLGTPRLLAWCEAATCAAIEPALDPGETSVGTRVELEHTRGSLTGVPLEVTATPTHRDGRLHRFSVVAREAGGGRVVGTAEITRVVVDAERFVDRLGGER